MTSHRHQKRLKECPLGILHQQTRQDNLRKNYLEAHHTALVNPVCQQGLDTLHVVCAEGESGDIDRLLGEPLDDICENIEAMVAGKPLDCGENWWATNSSLPQNARLECCPEPVSKTVAEHADLYRIAFRKRVGEAAVELNRAFGRSGFYGRAFHRYDYWCGRACDRLIDFAAARNARPGAPPTAIPINSTAVRSSNRVDFSKVPLRLPPHVRVQCCMAWQAPCCTARR